jgi:hypothetical protein
MSGGAGGFQARRIDVAGPSERRPLDTSLIHRIEADIERLRDKIDALEQDRNEDRIRRAEELAQLRVGIAAGESRLKTLESGLGRVMTHFTWVLRLLVGGVLAALLQFTIKGGLINGL